MNRYGIALAADSASTFYSPFQFHSKTYNSANKVFMLSYLEPVGMMVYGRADLAGVPWEPLCKYYRDILDLTTLPTLREYGKDFFEFLEANEDLFPASVRELSLQNFFTQTFRELLDYITQGLTNNDEKMLLNRMEEEIAVAFARLKETPYDQHVRDISGDLIEKPLGAAIQDVFTSPLPLSIDNQLRALGKLLIEKEIRPLPSGLVLAGYGTREIFGNVLHYQIGPFVGHKIKRVLVSEDSVAEAGAVVRAYAQQDVISLFMNGIDSSLYQAILDSVVEALRNAGVVDDKVQAITTSFQHGLEHMMATFSSTQLMEAIQYLPKEELAMFAESLVALTVLKRHISLDSETVGGPVDVAVLSKGDGFIWVKRKHYFDPNLNPYYFARLRAKFRAR